MTLYSTADAAEYLEMTVAAVKYHIHIAHNLAPQKVGRTLVFTQEQLDLFKSTKRGPGRPTKKEQPQ